jgi:hypothetical protein
MSSDAIVLLREDHKRIRGLFKDFQDAGESTAAAAGSCRRSSRS